MFNISQCPYIEQGRGEDENAKCESASFDSAASEDYLLLAKAGNEIAS
jgi:hypothetical protein